MFKLKIVVHYFWDDPHRTRTNVDSLASFINNTINNAFHRIGSARKQIYG